MKKNGGAREEVGTAVHNADPREEEGAFVSVAKRRRHPGGGGRRRPSRRPARGRRRGLAQFVRITAGAIRVLSAAPTIGPVMRQGCAATPREEGAAASVTDLREEVKAR